MNFKIFFTALIFSLCFPALLFASQGRLVFDKLRLDIHISMGDSACDELMPVDAGKDIPDMRGMDCYERTGKYTLTLDGPPGTTVTLFGTFSYGKESGYLVIRKMDNRLVWILHLEDFPNEIWSAREAGKDSGAYEVFYHAAPIFAQNVSSLKWGQWWSGESPQ